MQCGCISSPFHVLHAQDIHKLMMIQQLSKNFQYLKFPAESLSYLKWLTESHNLIWYDNKVVLIVAWLLFCHKIYLLYLYMHHFYKIHSVPFRVYRPILVLVIGICTARHSYRTLSEAIHLCDGHLWACLPCDFCCKIRDWKCLACTSIA